MDTVTLNYYNENASSFAENTKSVDMTEVWNKFLSLIPKDSLILDFGCGAGRDTKFFLDQGYTVEAIDGSEELCKVAQNFTGIQVKKQLFSEFSEENRYDGIWACSSILHATSKELIPIIGAIWQALKVQGIFYTSFKYGSFEGQRNGRYFTDMTESSFEKIISEHFDFKIIEMWVSKDARPDRGDEKWLNVLLQKK